MLILNRWGYVQIGNEIIKGMDHMEAYKIGLATWSKWIDSNIDPSKTRVLFQGIAAAHSGYVLKLIQLQLKLHKNSKYFCVMYLDIICISL